MTRRTRIVAALLLAASIILAVPALAAGWANVANLSRERAGHAAVTLPNGKVLVSGGCYGWKNLFTTECEIYDPAANTWTPTGAMGTPRSEHGLVVLQSGKVLAIGGFYQASDVEYYLSTCEIYDPASGTWSATGSMAVNRTVFSSTLLQNGKVLVAGGLNKNPSGADQYLAGAEVYDPVSGTWTTVPDLTQSRTAHTGTLLPNGKVLVVGGASGFTAIQAAEEFDPASSTWAPAGSLVKARALHIAVLLNSGKVLAAGGGSGFTGDVLKNPMADAEIYDPTSGTWTATNPMPFTRTTFPACLLNDGRVLVTGGLWYDGTNYYCRRKSDIFTPDPGQCTVTCTASAAPTSGNAPLTVAFIATATATDCSGAITYTWDFKDGGSSTEQNPSHTYTAAGTYAWTFTASAGGQSCTKDGTVTVTPGGGGKPGDCNGDGTVSIGEVQKAINMFLGIQAIGCGVDCNGNESVSIGEVQKVINCFLGVATSC